MVDPTPDPRGDPLVAYNFRVDIGGQTLGFSRVSGLQRAHKTVSYRHGRSFLEGEQLLVIRRDELVAVTLERGTASKISLLYDWLELRDPRPLSILVCDADGAPVLTWKILRAYPVKLTAPTFDASSNDVAIESLEIQASGITASLA